MSSYIPIASQTLGSSASSVTFSSIPTTLNGKTLRDLVLVASVDSGITDVGWKLNNNTSNRFRVSMEATGSTFQSATSTDGRMISYVADGRWSMILQLFDFAQTNKHKSMLVRLDDATADNYLVAASALRWGSTAAVTSLTIDSATFAAGSTFSLYGIEG